MGAGQAQGLLGDESTIGGALHSIGLRFVTNETFASALGWCVGFVAIWAMGALLRSTARYRIDRAIEESIERIPIVGSIYRPIAQVLSLLKREDKADLKSMRVVYCAFGQDHGAGVLGLQVSSRQFQFGERSCFLVYVPTSPLPMSGGLIFVPVEAIEEVDMEPEDLLKVYFSMGVLAETVLPLSAPTAAEKS